MRRTEWREETRKMRFEEAYDDWQARRLTQEEAARLLDRYEDAGLEGLIDQRLEQVSHRRAPVDEVMRLVETYRSRHEPTSPPSRLKYTFPENSPPRPQVVPAKRKN